MFGKRLVASSTCAVLAAGLLTGGASLTAQAAAGDAAYTQAVNNAIILSEVYGNDLIAKNNYPQILAANLTGTNLTSVASYYHDDDIGDTGTGDDVCESYAYEYDASGVQTNTAVYLDDLVNDYYDDEAPSYASVAFDAAGYPTQISVTENAYYTWMTWYNQTYVNTYDEQGRLSTVTQFTVRSANDPQEIELSTPSRVITIAYDEAGRVSGIYSQRTTFSNTYYDSIQDYMLVVDGSYEDAESYTYNELNEISVIEYVSTKDGGFSTHNEYTYNELGEVLTHMRVDSDEPNVLAANVQLVYDANGVLTQMYEIDNPAVTTYYTFQ